MDRVAEAAPDMLAALKAMLEASKPNVAQPGESRMDAAIRWGDAHKAAWDLGRAAVAKAEGEG